MNEYQKQFDLFLKVFVRLCIAWWVLGLLRFLGLEARNATQVARLQQHYRLAAPPALGTVANPLDPQLQAELEAYFQPFQAHLRKLFAMHRKCSLERAGKRKIAQQLGNALARAG